jgi:hypothetical protein
MRRFKVYRPEVPQAHLDAGRAVDPSLVQLEGVEFSNGIVVVQWQTGGSLPASWTSFDAFYKIHGHPEYGTVIQWLDEPTQK